jgi:transmembrane sensor
MIAPRIPIKSMATNPKSAESDRCLEEACSWLSRLNSGETSRAVREDAAAWRGVSPANERAWRVAEQLWGGMEALRRHPALPGSRPLPVESEGKRSGRGSSRLYGWRRPMVSGWAMTCAVLLAVVIYAGNPWLRWQADFHTNKGDRLTERLFDGTKVTLNTASAISTEFNSSLRHVLLLEGEAFFEVAKDAAHPFVVSTEAGEVVAVGTAFSVRRQDSELRVELVEGIVDVTDRRHGKSARLHAGQVAVIGSEPMQVQPPIGTENLAVWREGYLRLDGLPLREAVEQINRYRPGHVFLLNGNMAAHRVSGIFRLDDLDQAVANLAAAVPGLQKNTATPYLVFLR